MKLTALPTAKHFANAHFPGLYSVVIGQDGDCLTRLFIAKPGQLHADLEDMRGKFLWHAHGYDFRETTLLGSVVNYSAKVVDPRNPPPGPGGTFHQYHIEAGIDTGRRPCLTRIGEPLMMVFAGQSFDAGQSYEMNHEEIHRVVFLPCPETGWFACQVQELRKFPAPSVVYSPHVLEDVPYADDLYQEISQEEAQHLLNAISAAITTTLLRK